ncbi:mucoidy inhibitor MuiA family protein [Polymorphospora rubra]|uniref:mucoidy inhibitor MuiA family protein n=1 Tax=Polymorphospora rubra TaxID=338584 RepID=UPI001FEB3F27|nr:mucoidy inhibitor MuiA family protein [Polymorphospora rubra]
MTTPVPDPELAAPIVAVTVYPDRARVTRRGTVTLPAGEHRVRIGPLPVGLHRDSVRVGGHGPATVLGVDLVRHHQARTADPLAADLEERRRVLAGELAELADADAVENQRAEFFSLLAQRAGGTYARALASGDAAPNDVAGFAETFAELLTASKSRQRGTTRRRDEARDEVAALDRQLKTLAERRRPDQLFAVVIVEVAEADAEVQLELTYVVSNAGWTSTYDVRLDDGPAQPGGASAERLTLTWFGLVIQHTGEDWPECDLALSTARPADTATVPELRPWLIDRVRPMPVRAEPMFGAASMADGMPVPAAPSGPPPGARPRAGAPAPPVAERAAAVEQGPSAATYRPTRPVAVPSDGSAHRATVAVLDLATALDYVTAPVQSTDAHLRATVVNSSAHTLLPGPASVFHGGDFVGSTRLETWAPGEEVELALGRDDRVRVERERIRRTASKATLGSTRRREVEYRISVANHTPRPARVTVLDQLPVSLDEAIIVRDIRLEPAPAERTDMGELTWRLAIPPGESREVLLGIRVETKSVELSGWRE